MNLWFLWMPDSIREITLGQWPWTEVLGDPSLPGSASVCGVCARAHTCVRVCARGRDEWVTHFLVGKTAVRGGLSSKCNISYPKKIVGKQKGVHEACYPLNLAGPLKPAARHGHQPTEREGEQFLGICRAAFLQLSFLLRDSLELEILSPAASGRQGLGCCPMFTFIHI